VITLRENRPKTVAGERKLDGIVKGESALSVRKHQSKSSLGALPVKITPRTAVN
jgi:hypothetical protein